MLSRLNAKVWLAGAALTSLSLGAHAAGDPAQGEKKFYTCYGCHGIANYRNAYPDYSVPKLRHQNADYLIAALHEYRDGTRPHATMHAQAASLSDQDIEDIAAYLQGSVAAKATAAAAAPKAAQASGSLHRMPRRKRFGGGWHEPQPTDACRPACRLSGTGADFLPQRPAQKCGDGQHGCIADQR